MIASAILDRLLHHSITINIKGESFRLKEKRRAGLLRPKLETPSAYESPWPFTRSGEGGCAPSHSPNRTGITGGGSFK